MKHARSIDQFVDYESGSGHVLSIYLNVDQSNAANLNRGFETALDDRLRGTLGVLAARRVHELIYADGCAVFGGHCEQCQVVIADETICPYCESALRPVEDVLELAIGDALEKGATVEQVRGRAAETLKAAGGMGAFLRF